MYECPRCDYTTFQKHNLLKHLKRQNICKYTKKDISIEECLIMIENGKAKQGKLKYVHQCNRCNKNFDRKSRLDSHLIKCKNDSTETLKKELREEIMNSLKPEKPKIKSNNEYVYLIRTREFKNLNENVYKLGRTINPKSRFGSYPPGSEINVISKCDNCEEVEKNLLGIFSDKFIIRKDLGNEYFQGNINCMTKEIYKYLC